MKSKYIIDNLSEQLGFLELGKTMGKAMGRKLKVKLYDQDSYSFDDYITTYNLESINSESTYFTLPYSKKIFKESNDTTVRLYYKLSIEEGEYKTFPVHDKNYLGVNLIIYLPLFMESLSTPWTVSSSVMREWFNRYQTNNKEQQRPVANLVDIDWLLSFPSVKELYDKIVNEKIYFNEAAKNELWKSLQSSIELPSTNEGETSFNYISNKIVKTNSGEQKTIADIYHYQSRMHDVDWFSLNESDLNDMYGALGRFDFRIAANGKVKLVDSQYEITITKIGIFMRDQYDFIDNNWVYSQPLGYWDVVTQTPHIEDGTNRYLIKNDMFRSYSETTGKGGDYIIYSNIKELIVNESYNRKKS